jgi:hypothetical protein
VLPLHSCLRWWKAGGTLAQRWMSLTYMRRKKEPDKLKQILSALDEERIEDVRAILAELHPADIGNYLESLPPSHRHALWSLVSSDITGEVLLEVAEGATTSSAKWMMRGWWPPRAPWTSTISPICCRIYPMR